MCFLWSQIVVSVAAKQLNGVVASTLLKFIVFNRRAKRDALGIKSFKGLLHDTGMSFVQERVHTGCRMIPE